MELREVMLSHSRMIISWIDTEILKIVFLKSRIYRMNKETKEGRKNQYSMFILAQF